jgi:hypothetical protein
MAEYGSRKAAGSNPARIIAGGTMATQRYISTSFWTDKWIRELDPSERYLYMYLLTNSQTNIAGIYSLTLDRMAFDTGYDERVLKPMLDRFAKRGKAFFVEDEWIVIPNWTKHQRITERDNNRKGVDTILMDLPQSIFSKLASFGYKYQFLNDLGRPLEAPSKPLARSSNYSEFDSDSDTDTDLNPLPPNNDFDPVDSFDPPAVPAVAGRGGKTSLQTSIRNAFQSREPIWPKADQEVAALSWLSQSIQSKAKDLKRDPNDLALQLITKFWQLRQTGRDIWKRQPFYPSRMKGLWGDLVVECEKDPRSDDGSWLDKYEGAS